MKNFIITAMGRSGTTFLSHNMNKSKKWTVLHEAGKWHDLKRSAEEIQKRFNREYYGEVNSYLRFVVDKIDCEKKGVILRNPIDLWLSITSWHNQEKWANRRGKMWRADLRFIRQAIPLLLKLAETGEYYVISFNRMITELEYLKNIFEYFGVRDVVVDNKMLKTRINKTPERRKTSWEDFSPRIKRLIFNLNDNYLERIKKIKGFSKEGT